MFQHDTPLRISQDFEEIFSHNRILCSATTNEATLCDESAAIGGLLYMMCELYQIATRAEEQVHLVKSVHAVSSLQLKNHFLISALRLRKIYWEDVSIAENTGLRLIFHVLGLKH